MLALFLYFTYLQFVYITLSVNYNCQNILRVGFLALAQLIFVNVSVYKISKRILHIFFFYIQSKYVKSQQNSTRLHDSAITIFINP